MKKLLEFLFSNILWDLIKKVLESLLKDVSTTISYGIWISGFVILNGYLIYSYFIRKGHYFAFPFTGKLLSFFHFNNPDLFPLLNETALKKHISIKIDEDPFGEIIERITLYQGASGVSPYQLIIEAPEYHKGFTNLQSFWESEAQDLFEDHFIEAYRERPKVTFPYQKGNFWHDWRGTVVDIDSKLPDTLVSKNHKWSLYTT